MREDASVCKLLLFWGISFSGILLDSNNKKGFLTFLGAIIYHYCIVFTIFTTSSY